MHHHPCALVGMKGGYENANGSMQVLIAVGSIPTVLNF